jgi:GNAT superfamily N-acetyltransferase
MTIEVRAATDADRPDITALVREMMPGTDAVTRLSWLYDRNPGGRALTWLAHDHGQLAGCTSYFPFQLHLDGVRVRGALGGDGYVRPQYRRRGLGGLLHAVARGAMRDHGIACMYGAPGERSVTALKHGGSCEVGHVVRYVRSLRRSSLRGRILERVIQRLLSPPRFARLAPMEYRDDRVDTVWNAAAATIRLGAVRDAAFYTWRFIEAPSHREQPYVIVGDRGPIGACALERLHGGQKLRIVDLIAIPREWHNCLSAIANHAATTDALALDIKLLSFDGRRRAMWRSAFAERDAKPFLVSIPPQGDRRFLDPVRWFYCGADSDLDTLE